MTYTMRTRGETWGPCGWAAMRAAIARNYPAATVIRVGDETLVGAVEPEAACRVYMTPEAYVAGIHRAEIAVSA